MTRTPVNKAFPVEPWYPARVSFLATLWASNLSASKIATAINRTAGPKVTRNAVIGKVHRMRLPARRERRAAA